MGILSPLLIEKAELDGSNMILRIDSMRNSRFVSCCLSHFAIAQLAVSRRVGTLPVGLMKSICEKPGSALHQEVLTAYSIL